jgi:pilus assembly protein TadC
MAAHPQLGPLGRAVHRSSETGASVADALARLGSELRDGRRAQQEALARAVEVKASVPLGLCLLPAFVLIGIVPMIAGSFSLTFFGS